MLTSEIPIVPEHVWSKVADIRRLHQHRELPVVGSGPFILTELQGRPVRQAQGQRELLARRPEDRRAALRLLREQRRRGAGPAQGRRRPGQPAHPRPVPVAGPRGEHHAEQGAGRRFSELLINPGAATRDNAADRRRPPRVKDVGCARRSPRPSTPRRSSTRSSRASPSRPCEIDPAGVHRLALHADRGAGAQVRPAAANKAARRGRLPQGRRRHPQRPGRQAAEPAALRHATIGRTTSAPVRTSRTGWATSASASIPARSPKPGSTSRPTRATTTWRSPAGAPTPTRTTSCPCRPARSARPGRQGRHHRGYVCDPDLRRALRQAARRTRPRQAAGARQADAAALYETSPRPWCCTTTTRWRPTAPTSSPAFQPQPANGGVIREPERLLGLLRRRTCRSGAGRFVRRWHRLDHQRSWSAWSSSAVSRSCWRRRRRKTHRGRAGVSR